MAKPQWPAAAALALALAGCQAIYGDDGGAPAPTTVETPTGPAHADESPAATAAGGSGATVAAAGVAAAAVAGTLAGGNFGKRLGSRFDNSAREAAASAERRALADNAPADWSDPQSGVSGRVRPLRSFTDAAGRECREYSQTVTIAGQRQSVTGIACLHPGGDWSLVGS